MIHDELFELAEHLARRETRRPKQISLRQAVANAYYGVFHALAALCVRELVGWSQSWEAITPVYRALDHSSARRVFERDRNGATYGQEIASLGRIFIDLQQSRYVADYDPQPFWQSRQEVLVLIDRARQAVEAVRIVPSEKRLLLAVHLLARQR